MNVRAISGAREHYKHETTRDKSQQRSQTLSPLRASHSRSKVNKEEFGTLKSGCKKGSLRQQQSSRKQDDQGSVGSQVDPIVHSGTFRAAELKLECAMNALVETFTEVD